ncbi:MAG: hypothetical protein LBM75_01495 [Myxococcales bacterium]|jgi:uncharacterized protein YfaS (alpha-2-macroglobulin family)|nr:hypothetical protein [Myxococcales bacterium]
MTHTPNAFSARGALLALTVAFLAVTAACDEPASSPSGPISMDAGKGASPAIHSEWIDPELVIYHSGPSISWKSDVRIAFDAPQVETEAIGKPLDPSPFRFSPAVAGSASWENRSTLVFKPSAPLVRGQRYEVQVKLDGAPGQKIAVGKYNFVFNTIQPTAQFSVSAPRFDDPTKPTSMSFTGTIESSDEEDDAAIERTISFGDADVKACCWTHEGNTHSFTVAGLARTESDRVIRVFFDGSAQSFGERAEGVVTLPGIGEFKATGANAVQGDTRYLVVRFSDPIDPAQNLNGLIHVKDRSDISLKVEANTVRIFSTKAWKAKGETIVVDAGLRNALGMPLKAAAEFKVNFELEKPELRFATEGVILPSTLNLTLPVQVKNLRGVEIAVWKVFDDNVAQFLQVNDLKGGREFQRVGRPVWKKFVPIEHRDEDVNVWKSVGLDMSPLVKAAPSGLYRIELTYRGQDAVTKCARVGASSASEDDSDQDESPAAFEEDWEGEQAQASGWDGIEGFYDETNDVYCSEDRQKDPCHACFQKEAVAVARNVLFSDLGLIAKRGKDGEFVVVVTDLKTATPLPNALVKLLDFQQQSLAAAKTNDGGVARLKVQGQKPFLVEAKHGTQSGYLKLSEKMANAVAHFDVDGVARQNGIQGFLYGERGVWRPGDPIHLTFLLNDPDERLPPDHPVKLELFNARGQLVETITRTNGIDGFYAFTLKTADDAPTGDWLAKVRVGGALFTKVLKVETVMPNRLKIDLDFGVARIDTSGALTAKLSSEWLHGAPAGGLKADVRVKLSAIPTRFPAYPEFTFDAPAATYQSELETLFEDELDESGKATFEATLKAENDPPGMLMANFSTRVFEPGGNASVDTFSLPVSPYDRYLGLRLPKGDAARGMLLTDVKHEVKFVAVQPDGRPAGKGEVEVRLYKLSWRWWWAKGTESFAEYISGLNRQPLQTGKVEIGADGTGSWTFEIKYPDWGRYMVLARDLTSDHISGRIFYVDWPGWAGRAQADTGGAGATALTVATDKPSYEVGELVTLTFPASANGRALVSIESGTEVLSTAWVSGASGINGQVRHQFRVTADMAPNVYANVTLLQPHQKKAKGNDLPMRLYGITPIGVVNPKTVLKPVLDLPEVFRPEETARVSVREASGLPMTYTLAIVDEGLLGLTRFQTPNPWKHFFAREALGVKTWDLFDSVAGTFGGTLDKMLAIGGDDEGEGKEGTKKKRFPPMVRFLGPFALEAGESNAHQLQFPAYVGSVRVMAVAGHGGAFGSVGKSVPVRGALMLLATLPRVLGPEEEIEVPVAVFASEEALGRATVTAKASGGVELVGPATQTIDFPKPGEGMVRFKLKVKAGTGMAAFAVDAVTADGKAKAHQKIDIEVRMPSQRVSKASSHTIEPGERWTPTIELFGIEGTNEVAFELSNQPPIDLSNRLDSLIRYPHGCIEQTTSGVFPQIYLGQLLDLPAERQERVEQNIKAGIERLKTFQTSDGGFAYWPGQAQANVWGTTYAGHFLVEARRAGYAVPDALFEGWKAFQKNQARSVTLGNSGSELEQAYRLYVLALAGEAELGAMNQLRDRAAKLSDTTRWRLAATYALAGQPEAATALIQAYDPSLDVADYRELSGTFGSALRDRAMILEALVSLKKTNIAWELATSISNELSTGRWMSTQELGYALVALAHLFKGAPGTNIDAELAIDGNPALQIGSTRPILQQSIEVRDAAAPQVSLVNKGSKPLYARLFVAGVPMLGTEQAASSGMALDVTYRTPEGQALDVDALGQGSDFMVELQVRNQSHRKLEQVALSYLVPSGWEIANERMDATASDERESSYDYRDQRDDRVYTYLSLDPGASKTYRFRLNASYLGRFYRPMAHVEAMYEATTNAQVPGGWVTVTSATAAPDGDEGNHEE